MARGRSPLSIMLLEHHATLQQALGMPSVSAVKCRDPDLALLGGNLERASIAPVGFRILIRHHDDVRALAILDQHASLNCKRKMQKREEVNVGMIVQNVP